MAEVFVIFAPTDAARAKPVLEALSGAGVKLAYSQPDLPVNERVDRAAAQIKSAPAVVVLLSEGAWSSTVMERELTIAREYGAQVIAATLEPKLGDAAWRRLWSGELETGTEALEQLEATSGNASDAGKSPLLSLWERPESASESASADRSDAVVLRQAGLDELIAAVNVALEASEPNGASDAAPETENKANVSGAPKKVEPALAGALWEAVRNSTDLTQLRQVRTMLADDPYFSVRAEARIEELLRRKRDREEREDRIRTRERVGSVSASLVAVAVAALMFWAIVQRVEPSGADGGALSPAELTIASLQEEVADLAEQLAASEDQAGAVPEDQNAAQFVSDGDGVQWDLPALLSQNTELTAANKDLSARIAAFEAAATADDESEAVSSNGVAWDIEALVQQNALLTSANADLSEQVASLQAANEGRAVTSDGVAWDIDALISQNEELSKTNAELEARLAVAAAPGPDAGSIDAGESTRIASLENDLAAARAQLEAQKTALESLDDQPENSADLQRDLAERDTEIETISAALEEATARADMLETELADALRELSASERETETLQAYVDRVRVLKGWPAGDPGAPLAGGGGAGLLFDYYLVRLNETRAAREAASGSAARFPIVSRGDLISLQYCLEQERNVLVGIDGVFGLRTMQAIAALDPAGAAAVLDCVES